MIHQNCFKIKKILIGCIVFPSLFSISSFAQDSLKTISISYNLIQACINEQSLYIELSPFQHHAFGFSIGKMYDNPIFEVFPFSPSQNEYPGTVYRGSVYRIKYAYIFEKTRSFDYSVGAQLIYKDMYYNNKDFRDGGDTYRDYSRNEKANVFGFDIVYDLNKYVTFNKYLTMLLNLNFGVGWRDRHRNIDTYYLNNHGSPGPHETDPPQLGNETKTQKYLVPVLGLKVGFRFHI